MTSFEETLEAILRQETRYAREAYVFVQMAMDFYRARHADEEAESQHLTGQELLLGVKELALEQFGPMAPQVLNHWGLSRGEDVGEIVYLFLDHGLMNKTESDQKEDFAGVMEFDPSMTEDYRW